MLCTEAFIFCSNDDRSRPMLFFFICGDRQKAAACPRCFYKNYFHLTLTLCVGGWVDWVAKLVVRKCVSTFLPWLQHKTLKGQQ